MPAPESLFGIAALLAVATALAAVIGGVVARGSTAVPAAAWAAAAAGGFGIEALARWSGWLTSPAAGAAARLGVVALAACPMMSLLGAKRPQHGVWQFIVLALGVTLALPAVTAVLVRPGTMPDAHLLERWFMLGLAVLGWMNFAATRHGAAATLITAGHLLVARPFLPGFSPEAVWPGLDCAAAGMTAAGACLAVGQSWPAVRRRGSPPATPLARIDAVFQAVRETFGAAWSLRIAERFNAIAVHRGWPCRLSFAGLRVEDAVGGTNWERDAARGFRALARRFVNDAWLSRHGWGDRDVDRRDDAG